MTKIAFCGCKSTTYECLKSFLKDGFEVNQLITMSPEWEEKAQIAGYMDLTDFAKQNSIPVYQANSYSLKDEKDVLNITSLDIDCLLVIGWQRLIPEWFLNSLKFGAFGMHGSPEPLPRGRGRSPLNWSLLNGKKSFLTHLFKYDPGVDSGEIVDVQKFDINSWDDCHTLHLKNRISMNKLLKKNLPQILEGKKEFIPQPKDIEPTYFPKRTAEDGIISWLDHDMTSLFNHVRCQTRPFPGAYTYLNGKEKYYFWKATPFDSHITYPGALPGTVVEVFEDNTFLVSVWDGSIRVIDFSSPSNNLPKLGDKFESS